MTKKLDEAVAPTTKTVVWSEIISKMLGMKKDDLTQLAASLKGEHGEGVPDGASARNQASVSMKSAVKEDVDALLEGEGLTEEFKDKAAVLFEAAVASRVALTEVALEEAYQEKLTEEVASIYEHLEAKADEYMTYVAKKWMAENEVAIDESLTTEITQEFIGKLKNVFAESYIEVPADKVDAFKEIAAANAELEEKLNEAVQAAIDKDLELAEFKKNQVFTKLSEGLAVTQVEKLKTLAESVDFDGDAEAYAKKLGMIKDKFVTTAAKPTAKPIMEEAAPLGDIVEEKAAPTGPMAHYVKAIKGTIIR